MGWVELADVRLPSAVNSDVLRCSRYTATWRSSRYCKAHQASTPPSARSRSKGGPLEIPVGEGWLGRVWDGMGEPLDGGPPMLGSVTRPVAGSPLNPTGATSREIPS